MHIFHFAKGQENFNSRSKMVHLPLSVLCGDPREGLLSLRKNRPLVSPAGHKKQLRNQVIPKTLKKVVATYMALSMK